MALIAVDPTSSPESGSTAELAVKKAMPVPSHFLFIDMIFHWHPSAFGNGHSHGRFSAQPH
jgi:hypothetical protein